MEGGGGVHDFIENILYSCDCHKSYVILYVSSKNQELVTLNVFFCCDHLA